MVGTSNKLSRGSAISRKYLPKEKSVRIRGVMGWNGGTVGEVKISLSVPSHKYDYSTLGST